MTEPLVDDSNLYAPPQSTVADIEHAQTPQFYVVAPVKCLALFYATLGFYSFYWFWRHWTLHKRRYALDLWPVPRSIFQVFFTHSLFREIDFRMQRVDTRHRWSPAALAWVYVIFTVIGNILDQLVQAEIGFPVVDILSLLTLLPMSYAMLQAQRAANIACGDPEGARNRRFTATNYLWLIFGFVLWALIAIGLLLSDPEMMQ